jgi:DNA-binding phage protein
MTDNLDQMRLILRDLNIQAVARSTGLSANAIYRFLQGGTQPKFQTILRLQTYLKRFAENG